MRSDGRGVGWRVRFAGAYVFALSNKEDKRRNSNANLTALCMVELFRLLFEAIGSAGVWFL